MTAAPERTDRLRSAGTHAGKIGWAGHKTSPAGKPCLCLRVDCAEGAAWVNLWLTPKGKPLALRKLAALGAGPEALDKPENLVGLACKVDLKPDGDRLAADLPFPGSAHLSEADRAELCRRVDFLAILGASGVDVKPKGTGCYTCKLRAENTASAYVWAPGHGKHGAAGWTWHDFGSGAGGDALAFLTDLQGLPFVDAVKDLCDRAGYTPPGWGLHDAGNRAPVALPALSLAPPPSDPLAAAEQKERALGFLLALLETYPEAVEMGDGYLAARGVLSDAGPLYAALGLPASACDRLASRLVEQNLAGYLRAGYLKQTENGPRLCWTGDCVLFPCRDESLAPRYFIARRLDPVAAERWGKYSNQTTAGGAVRWPYNLPALYQCAGHSPANRPPFQKTDPVRGLDLLLVEGALDALGAAALGWPAVALLSRPEARGWKDTGAACAMLSNHTEALRDCARVLVVPDADEGEKGLVGIEKAAGLVAWLRGVGARAELATLADLWGPLPAGVKDFADLAKHEGNRRT